MSTVDSPERAPRRAAAPLTAVLLLVFSSCAPKPAGRDAKGSLVSCDLSLSSYVRTSLDGTTNKAGGVFFPQLEIYDESGYLVYSSHESIENARILREIPSGLQGLRPKTDAPLLEKLVEAVPALHARKAEILEQHRMDVLSIFLQDCHACAIQEDALSDAGHQLLARGMNVLVIHVSRP